ncbi:hypothetical protein [truncated ORF], partial [Aspergillus niger]|uniref:Uncharacterized protein n=2 Tax=Aspergillus niger TaxID=5061 RepID=A0AAJ8DZY7_ASPNG
GQKVETAWYYYRENQEIASIADVERKETREMQTDQNEVVRTARNRQGWSFAGTVANGQQADHVD